MKYYLQLFIVLLITGCSDTVEIQAGHDSFIIPKQNLLADYSDNEGSLLEYGFDTSSLEFALLWSPDEIAKFIPEYVKKTKVTKKTKEEYELTNNITPSFYSLNIEDKKSVALLDSYYQEIFLLKGKYNGAEVEHDSQTGYYRVYYPDGRKTKWEAFKLKPGSLLSSDTALEDFWAGRCSSVLYDDSVTCSTDFVYRDFLVSFEMSGENFRFRDQLKNLIIDQVEGWRQK